MVDLLDWSKSSSNRLAEERRNGATPFLFPAGTRMEQIPGQTDAACTIHSLSESIPS